MPLRSILQDFLDYVASVDDAASVTVSTEHQHLQADHYDKEFQELKLLTDEIRAQNSCSCGEKEVNRRKNRYKDILPYDLNRVTLSEVPGVTDSDYINASYIKGASGSKAYIASQAPLPNTVDDFWRMIFETDVQVIVMASNEIEAGRPKCERYWPNEGEEKVFGNITVTLEQQRDMCDDFKVKRLKAKMDDSPPRTLHHFHYHNWPDHGVPTSVNAILDMVELIRRDFQPSETLPVLVHCSAGCGRTGTVCAIDFVWGLLRAGKLNEEFSLKQLILELRRQRIAMVQTKEQYVLVHRAVKELFERHLKVIDDHPYENVDFSGKPLGFVDEPDYANIIRDDVNPYENVMLPNIGNDNDAVDEVIVGEQSRSLRSLDIVGTDTLMSSLEKPSNSLKIMTRSVESARETDRRDRSPTQSAQTKMEYVNDWCAGIDPNNTSASSERDKEQPSPRSLRDENCPRVEIKRLSMSGDSTASSSSTSLARSKASGAGGGRTHSHRERPIVSLVRKPSIAKLRELFSGNANSDLVSPSSPEEWTDSPSPILRRDRAATDSLENPSGKENNISINNNGSVTQSLVKLKRRAPRHSKNYVDDKEYERLVSRYMDASLQIFKENRQGGDYEIRSNRGSQLKLQQISPSLSASSEGIIGTTASSIVSIGNQSTSSSIFRTRDSDLSSLSPATLRHTPSPGHSSSPSPRDRSDKVTEFVGRLVRSRRNSASEKRSSTWYDDITCNEGDTTVTEPASILPQTTAIVKTPNRVTMFFGGGDRDRKSASASPEDNSSSNSVVKRSISMKVGFGSPFIRRRRNPQTDVAAYLAVEDNRKNGDDKSKIDETDKAIDTKSKNQNPVKQQSNLSRKLHGYVNVKPVQNNSRYLTDEGPVELKNFSPRCDDAALPTRTADSVIIKQSTNEFTLPTRHQYFPTVESSLKKSPIPYRRKDGSPIVGHQSQIVSTPSPSSSRIDRRKADTASPNVSRKLTLFSRDPITKPSPSIVSDDRFLMKQQDNEDRLIDEEVSEVVQRLERELRKRSSLPSSSHNDEKSTRQIRRTPPFNKDDMYGAEMDEYCQKMLEDCRDYLLTHHYSNLTDEARRNIRWIEDTIHRSPRHAIMDVTSSTENLCNDLDDKVRSRLGSGPHNYEKLWLSHSGNDEASNRFEIVECSVDEATIDFPPQYDDEEDDDLKSGVQSRSQWFHTEKQTPKDGNFSEAVVELQTLIDELEVDTNVKKRKPQPAPRTVLNITGNNGDAVRQQTQHSFVVLNELDEKRSRQPKVEQDPLLGSSNDGRFPVDRVNIITDICNRHSVHREIGSDLEDGARNHEYEEIKFRDERPVWTCRDPVYSEYPASSGDIKRRASPKNGVAPLTVGLYGEVNKPRRRKHSLSREAPPSAAAAAETRARRYHQMRRGEAAVSSRDYRVPMTVPQLCTGNLVGDADDVDDSLVINRPIAPPRVRRQYMSSSFSAKHGVDGSDIAQSGFYSSKPQTTILKVNTEYGPYGDRDVVDEDANAPPVPVKTKDSYVPLLGKGKICSDQAQSIRSSSVNRSSSSSSGISFSKKKFNKMQTSLLSKLGIKSDKDSDTSSNGSAGGVSPKITRKGDLDELNYPNRLGEQLKSQRDPPGRWKVTTA